MHFCILFMTTFFVGSHKTFVIKFFIDGNNENAFSIQVLNLVFLKDKRNKKTDISPVTFFFLLLIA